MLDQDQQIPESSYAESRVSGEICAGCAELTERVERLERQLAAMNVEAAHQSLSATSCYWICVGVHAFAAFALFCNEVAVQIGSLAIVGAAGTLATSHVLSTRPTFLRLFRSLLSMTIVGANAILAILLGDVAELSDILAPLCVYVPMVIGPAWLVAKMFVWIRGWRIAPPNGPTKFPQLRIQHLLAYTFLAAAGLAFARAVIKPSDLSAADVLETAPYVIAVTSLSAVFSCLFARLFLQKDNPRIVKQSAILTGCAVVAGTGIWMATLMANAGGTSSASEILQLLAIYVPMSLFSILASPCFTFLMLRFANYRFIR